MHTPEAQSLEDPECSTPDIVIARYHHWAFHRNHFTDEETEL